MDLAAKKCIPCEGGVFPLTKDEAEALLAQLHGWELSDGAKKIEKSWKFADFAQALAFVNKIGAIAEEENHHPEIEFTWGKVEVELSTHSIGGLSENDFILAAKIDALA
jgi:4a-hydroxytetrahydrobiopterin dehydratase